MTKELFSTFAMIVLAALVIVQVSHIIVGYQTATGTPGQRFLAAFSHSLTIAVARAGMFLSVAAAYAVDILPTLDPTSTVGMAITSMLEPKYAAFYPLVLMVLVEMARRRAGSLTPVSDTVTPVADSK